MRDGPSQIRSAALRDWSAMCRTSVRHRLGAGPLKRIAEVGEALAPELVVVVSELSGA